MKGIEKFEKRLEDLGILEDWRKQGSCGRISVSTDDCCYVFVHEDDEDYFSEMKYPPMSELSQEHISRENIFNAFDAIQDFDNETIGALYRWMMFGGGFPLKNVSILYSTCIHPYAARHFEDDPTKKFEVVVEEVFSIVLEIDASSEDEAENIVRDRYDKGSVPCGDLCDTKIYVAK